MNKIVILGVGNILFSDEGFGIHLIDILKLRYDFPSNISLVDGGVLGISLLGVISESTRLIVIDIIKNQGKPGTIYKISGNSIPERIRIKNSIHQIDFLETLTICQLLNKMPETTIIGVEPEDIKTLSTKLSVVLSEKIDIVIYEIFRELDKLNVKCLKKNNY